MTNIFRPLNYVS